MKETMADFMDWADTVKKSAITFPKRRSDKVLYKLLADCMRLAKFCEEHNLLEGFKQEVINRDKSEGKKRAYFSKSADAFLVVGRYMFTSEETDRRTDTAWRYTACMREAEKHQISPDNLETWLTSNGGINSLFKARNVKRRTRTTSVLHLLEKVTTPKFGEFTITLKDNGAGYYHVTKFVEKEN